MVSIRNTELRERLYAALLKGESPKAFAMTNHVSLSWAYRLTWELGFKSVYVSEQEHNELKRIRNHQRFA